MLEPKRIVQTNGGEIWRLSLFQGDNRLITPSADGSFEVWDTRTWECICRLKGHSNHVRSVRITPDGTRAVSCGGDKNVVIWDLDAGRYLHQIPVPTPFDLQILGDAKRFIVATRSQEPLQIHDLGSGRLLGQMPVDGEEVYSLALVPESSQMVLGGADFLELWDLAAATRIHAMKHVGSIHGIAVTSNGDRIVAGGSRTIGVWDRQTGRRISTFEGLTGDSIFGLAVSPDDRFVIAGNSSGFGPADGDVIAWELGTGRICWRNRHKKDGVRGIAIPASRGEFFTGHADGTLRIWDLPDAATTETIPASVRYTNAKAVLVGHHSSGKTCLARALMDRPFEPQESTHGMKVWNFESETVEHPEGGQIIRETMLWDLAGQVDYQVVHQLFLDETTLGLVVFDPTDPLNPFGGVGHWEKALARAAGEDCSRLLVAGRVDRGHPTATEDDIETFRKEHGYKQFVATSAKTGLGVAETREAIRRAIPWDRLPITSSPELWKQMREYLLKRRGGQYVLTARKALCTAFRRQHKGVKFAESDFDTVISIAQTQGLIWRLSFGDQVLMKPELLNNYAAAIVRVARKHPQGLGCVAERDVLEARIDFEDLKRLAPKIEQQLLYSVVQLFLQREVALRGGANDELIVFPSKYNRKLPDIPQPPLCEVAYRFAGPVEDIYATLAVRLFYSDAFELKDLYQNAAEYYDVRKRISGLQLDYAGEGEGVISAYFEDGTSLESKMLFLRFIHEHLHHRGLRQSIKRERIYRCSNTQCQEEVTDRKAIDVRLEKALTSIPCQYCDRPIELVDALESEFGDPKLQKRVREMEEEVAERRGQQVGSTVSAAKDAIGEYDVFLAHNSADKPQVEVIARTLRQRGLNPWLDIEAIPPGRWFQDLIQDAIRDVKSAVIVIGSEGLGRWHALEMRSFISLCVDRKIPVIPVLLPGVTEVPKALTFLRELNWVKFDHDIDEREAFDDLVWGITGEHPTRRPR